MGAAGCKAGVLSFEGPTAAVRCEGLRNTEAWVHTPSSQSQAFGLLSNAARLLILWGEEQASLGNAVHTEEVSKIVIK